MPCGCWVRQPVYILCYLAIALYCWCTHKFYLHMTMSCGSWWNRRIACAWHSVLYLIAVLTIQKESNNLPSRLQVLKTFSTTSIGFILSDPLTPHFTLLSSHLTLCTVCPVLSLHPFNLIKFSLCILLTYHSCHQLNFHSLDSLCIVPHLHYLLRLLTVVLGD